MSTSPHPATTDQWREPLLEMVAELRQLQAGAQGDMDAGTADDFSRLLEALERLPAQQVRPRHQFWKAPVGQIHALVVGHRLLVLALALQEIREFEQRLRLGPTSDLMVRTRLDQHIAHRRVHVAATGKAPHRHARSQPCLHAVDAILDHQAIGRRDAQLRRRVQEKIGRGLGVRHMFGGIDVRRECIPQRQFLQLVIQRLDAAGTGGGDAANLCGRQGRLWWHR